MIPVPPGPKEIIGSVGEKFAYIDDDRSQDPDIVIGHGNWSGGVKGYDKEHGCKQAAQEIIDKDDLGITYDYGIDVESFPMKIKAYFAYNRRQKTSLGTKFGDPKGVPLFDDNGDPVFGNWEVIKDFVSDTENQYKTISSAVKSIERNITNVHDDGKARRILVEYKVVPKLMERDAYICTAWRKKVRDYPSHYVDKNIVIDPASIPAVDPLAISSTPLRTRVTGIERSTKTLRVKQGKYSEEIKDNVANKKPARVTVVDASGKEIIKDFESPVFVEINNEIKGNVGANDINSDAFASVLVSLGFDDNTHKSISNEYENVRSFSKAIEYEKKSDIDGTMSCRVNVYQYPGKIVPNPGKSSVVPKTENINVVFDKLRQNQWKFYFNVIAASADEKSMDMAPAEAVEKCTADIKAALARAKFVIKDYPDRVLTPSDFDNGSF